jgi:mono/diheme cytochrome c family protein
VSPRIARALLSVLCVFAACAPVWAQAGPSGLDSWREISRVMHHPRCANCHTSTDYPRQGDDQHRHQQLVSRGKVGLGVPALQCSACHQIDNSHGGAVPGAKDWQLPPDTMGWDGLDDARLCANIKDKKKNANRDLAKLEDHMITDPIIQWAWDPGPRTHPPVDREAFHAAVRSWIKAGAPCPK